MAKFKADEVGGVRMMKQAEWYCEACGAEIRDEDVNVRMVGGIEELATCKKCKEPCVRLSENVNAGEVVDDRALFARLGSAAGYPFRGTGWAMFLFGTVFLGVIEELFGAVELFSRFGVVAALPAVLVAPFLFYLFAFLMRVVEETARGNEEIPYWPEITDWWDDVILPTLRFFYALCVTLVPAFWYWSSDGSSVIAFNVILGLGLFYFPMAVISMCMHESVWGMLPHKVIPAILKTFLDYVLIWGLEIGAVVAAYLLVNWVADVPYVGSILITAVELYLLIMVMHLLGILYAANENRIGWFVRRGDDRFDKREIKLGTLDG